jgi:selenoprotein W-related protein
LAAKLKATFAQEVSLIAAGGGLFEVTHDNNLIYSKKQTGEFPNEADLIGQINHR